MIAASGRRAARRVMLRVMRALGVAASFVAFAAPAVAQPAPAAPPAGEPPPPDAAPQPSDRTSPDAAPQPEPLTDPIASGNASAAPGAGARVEVDSRAAKVEPATTKDRPTAAEKAPEPEHQGSFSFGSYGRMIAATDARGGPGRDADIVAHGSRLDEGNYVELELRRDDDWAITKSKTRLVATLAFASPVFHYTGEFDANLAVRNLYIEERDLALEGLSVFAGSRMLRGDDIYLLDWWPSTTSIRWAPGSATSTRSA